MRNSAILVHKNGTRHRWMRQDSGRCGWPDGVGIPGGQLQGRLQAWPFREVRQLEGVRGQALDGTGGTWFGATLSIGHLVPISTPGRRGMFLGGGVAGAEPPHKGGRLRPTAQNSSGRWSVVRYGTSPASELIGDWSWLSGDLRHAKVRPHFGMRLAGKHCRLDFLI